jgi:hypothetical protein
MFGLAHYLIKQLQQSPLLVRYELRVTDNVDEEHIGDLQFDLFFNLYRHPLMLPKNQPIDNLILRGPWRAQLALREMVADQDEQLAHIRLIRVFFFELLVPVVQRKEQGFPKTKRIFYHTSSAVFSTMQTTFSS